MDRSTRSIPLHLQIAPRQLLGMPLTFVLVSILSIANAGVFAASVAWPFRSRAEAAPTTAVKKTNVITLSRRLKGDRIAAPNVTGDWLEQPGSRQDKDEVQPQEPEPQLLFPLAPAMPHDDDGDCEPLLNAQSGSRGNLTELCTAAIETYRKVAAIPHGTTPVGIGARNARREARYI
jgi:hypothetical protein